MPDEQTVGHPPTPLPGGGELGHLSTMLMPDPVVPDATSPAPTQGPSPSVGSEYMAVFVGETHAYITQYIQTADQKAIFMFSAAAALLAFLYQDGAPSHWIKPLSEWGPVSVLTFVGSTALAAAAVLAATPDGLLAAKCRHSYTLARVCHDKYYVLRAAVLFRAVGVAATVLYFVFSGATRGKL